MMVEYVNDAVSRLSFPDCVLSEFVSGLGNVTFQSDGIFVEGEGFYSNGVIVKCSVDGVVSLREYADGAWTDLDPVQAAGLCEILEWYVDNDALIISGFQPVSGQWNEYRVAQFSMKTVMAKSKF